MSGIQSFISDLSQYSFLDGLLVSLGILVSVFVSQRAAKARSLPTTHLYDSLLYTLIGGIMGARLWYLLVPNPSMGITTRYYFTHPWEAANLAAGGNNFMGALLGGGLVLILYSIRHDEHVYKWLDVAAIGIPFGYSLGILSNIVNQVNLGFPTDIAWAIHIRPEFRILGFEEVSFFHPISAYISLLSLLFGLALYWVSKRFGGYLRDGDLFFIFSIGFCLIRMVYDLMLLDAAMWGSLRANHWTVGVILIVFVGLQARRKKQATAGI